MGRGQLNKISSTISYLSRVFFPEPHKDAADSLLKIPISHIPGLSGNLLKALWCPVVYRPFTMKCIFFINRVWFFQLCDSARGKNIHANKVAELGNEVSIWLELYFRCFSVEAVLPFFRSDHKLPVHNSSLQKPAFIKELVQGMVRLLHHWRLSEKGRLLKRQWLTEKHFSDDQFQLCFGRQRQCLSIYWKRFPVRSLMHLGELSFCFQK